MSDTDVEPATRREKIDALLDVAQFDPRFSVFIIVLGLCAAALEGAGLGFILPVVELIQTNGPGSEASGVLGLFVAAYRTLGIPFTLSYVIIGVATVISLRYTLSFIVTWFGEALRTYYVRDLQMRAFDNALYARIAYFDKEGSDDILNAIITQTFYAGRVIKRVVDVLQDASLAVVYLLITLIISPQLTVLTLLILGGITGLLRYVIQPGYELGDEVAKANEHRQKAAQAGTQGIRDVRIFGVAEELFEDFGDAVDQYTGARVALRRNEAAITNFYSLLVAVSVFALIYLALVYANLSLGALGVFLFAMFRLGPTVSRVNNKFYQVENDLPHLVRTQEFIEELSRLREPSGRSEAVPDEIEEVEFDDVWFSYDGEEDVLEGVDFEVERGEFVAFVGQSGAGKSTIVSLLLRLYSLDGGEIRANGVPIEEMDLRGWRDRISVVQQDPYIFDDTLEYNLTIGDRDASHAELERVCEIAQIDEFLGELPEGLDTMLGDDGVRLSGGQRQRVALGRALLEDADLLVLDEATSDLDSNLEKDVQRAIETMDRDYAVIAIAHRLSTVRNADRIYTLDAGQITESGTHEELVENEGTYAELYAIQSVST